MDFKRRIISKVLLIAFLWSPSPLKAVETTGTPGSPESTTTIDSKTLPPAPQKFGGIIKQNAAESKAWWPARIVPPKGAPNILLIMTDDVGFGAPSTFGGTIPTPTLDKLAAAGLRYTQFHSTALCSPTRAALLTGRNHHSVGFGMVQEVATGYPGYNGNLGRDTVTIAEVLKQNGYSTALMGKSHLTPIFETSAAGPFDRWPNGLGFEYFYGFMGGETSQWKPILFKNTEQIAPYFDKPEWNLITAMADEAINWMSSLNAVAPEKPFFLYYVPGATHAPHHPTPEWIEKFKGKFDHGWDKEREVIFANQKKLGVIPQDAQLTPWPEKLIPRWESLSPEKKKLYARQAEVYAAFLAYTDHEIGRVIDSIESIGKLDNTLIIFISGDNGASAEGGIDGTPNQIAWFNGIDFSVEEQLKLLDNWGDHTTGPNISVGWSWTFDTPFKWLKQAASHFGATRQGMVISWPNGIKDPGGIRNQFHHVVDITPTLFEVTGIQVPDMVNGVKQRPIEGVSLAYTFKKENAKAASQHKTQYFEMFGNRGLYHDGWMISTTPKRLPWDPIGPQVKDPFNDYKWELYDLSKDWTQFDDLAAKHPGKLEAMKKIFVEEANKYHVFPLNDSITRVFPENRPGSDLKQTEFVYKGEVKGIPPILAPNLTNKSYSIKAEIDVPEKGAEGIIVTMGGDMGGYGLYVLKGRPVFLYNYNGFDKTRWEGEEDELKPGKHVITFDFVSDGGGLGVGGQGILKVDDIEVANKRIEKTIFIIDELFTVNGHMGSSLEEKDYMTPFRFNGKIEKVTITLKPGFISKIVNFVEPYLHLKERALYNLRREGMEID